MDNHNQDYAERQKNFANDPPLQLTLRELRAVYMDPRFWLGMVFVVVLLVVTGPFGTIDTLDIPTRIVYWAFIAITTFAIGLATSFYVGASVTQMGTNELIARIFGVSVAGFLVGLFVWGINKFVFNMNMEAQYSLITFLAIAVLIAACIAALFFLIVENKPPTHSPSLAHSSNQFFDRLPKHLGRNLISIEAQDHYIKVTTTKGTEMILMRLADAEIELSNHKGIRVHRSWWVAQDHIQKVTRDKGKTSLIMQGGAEIPVARSYTKTLREAGVL